MFQAMAYDSQNLATPRLELLGIRPTDWVRYGVDFNKLAPLSVRDRKKAMGMLGWKSVAAFPELRLVTLVADDGSMP